MTKPNLPPLPQSRTIDPAVAVRYRDGVLEDARVLDALFRRQFAESYGHRYSRDDIASFFAHRTAKRWEGTLSDPGHRVRVATADGTVVGYVKLGPMSLPYDVGRGLRWSFTSSMC
jgi:hypothetical protein